MIKRKAGTITLALGLIVLGALLFAQNFTELPVSNIYKYWPVLLIGLGIEILGFMIFQKGEAHNYRIRIDPLLIIFIILIALFAGNGGIKNYYFDFNLGQIGNTVINGIHYKDELKESYFKDNISNNFAVEEVRINNEFGDIKVVPAASGQKSIKVEADIKVKCNDKEKARAYIKDAVEIKEGEITEISPKTPQSGEEKYYAKAYINFVIYVPENIKVDIRNGFGGILVQDIKGDLSAKNNNGEVSIKDVDGNVAVLNSFGEIEVKDVSGKADIRNQNGAIDASDIAKDTVLETHFGSIDAENIGGRLVVNNNNGSIDINGVSGDLEVRNSFGSIYINGVKGVLTVSNNNGKIYAEDVLNSASIKNSFGDIEYKSENIKNADLYASTEFGRINADAPILVKRTSQKATAEGKLGTGQYKIELTTNNGSIIIKD